MDSLLWLVIMGGIIGIYLIGMKVAEHRVFDLCKEQGQVEMVSGGKIKCEVIK